MLVFVILLVFIVLSAALARYFITHDHGEREPIGALWLAAGFGFGGAIAAAALEYWFVPIRDINRAAPLSTNLLASLGVGAIEEACKFIPLAFFLYPKRYFNEYTDGIIYFAVAGLGFGLPENLLYTLQLGASAGLARVLLTPFFHAAITAMVGYWLIRAKLTKRSLVGTGLVLLLAMLLHGLYDFGLASGVLIYASVSIVITLTLSSVLFMLYLRATELDQRLGLSVVGHNSFCRSCGHPNSSHHLYCVRCGRRA